MRFPSILAVLGTAALLAPSTLEAQTLPQRDRPLTVTVHMAISYPLGPADDPTTVQQQARDAFYKMAAGECSHISEAMTGDCTLMQVNINTRQMSPRTIANQPSEPTVAAEGSMSFAVTPKQ